MSCVSN